MHLHKCSWVGQIDFLGQPPVHSSCSTNRDFASESAGETSSTIEFLVTSKTLQTATVMEYTPAHSGKEFRHLCRNRLL